MSWEHLGIPQDELEEVACEKDMCFLTQPAATATLSRISGGKWMDWMATITIIIIKQKY